MATPSFKVSPRAQTSYRTLEGRGPTKGAPSLRKAIAAARSVTPHEGLDVELLARAEHERACEWRHQHDWTGHIAKQRAIAAEYAALLAEKAR